MFKSIMLNDARLVVYPDGKVLRYYNGKENKYMKKGWNVCNGSISADGTNLYKKIQINSKKYSIHRIVASAFLGLDIQNKDLQIDHIDRNKLNNNKNNLRIVSHQQNQFNRGAKGYNWDKHSSKYRAQIRLDNKNIYLGLYDTEEDARNAYLEAKEKYHII